MARAPRTVFEDRIDFDRIKAQEKARTAEAEKRLRSILARSQTDTLRWVDLHLRRKREKTAIRRYQLPYAASIRAAVRKQMEEATLAGKVDVARELGIKKENLTNQERSRSRETADATTDDLVSTIESSLKLAWAAAMNGNVNGDQLEYVTRKAFADFAGWVQPEPP